jgi:hypothetical protein
MRYGIAFLSLLIVQAAFPCTIFNANDGVRVMAGNNEDFFERDTWVWFVPSDGVSYGAVYTGFENAWPQGGANEKGLFFDWFAGLDGSEAPVDPAKRNLGKAFGEAALERCETVDQALALFDAYNVPDIGYAQLMLADRRGGSAVVSWDWKAGKVVIERSASRHQVIGARADPVELELERDGTTLTPERFRELAKLARQPALTVYSTVYDLNAGDMYLYYNQNYSIVKKFDIDAELRRGAHVYGMRALFPSEGRKTASVPLAARIQSPFLELMVASLALSCAGLIYWIAVLLGGSLFKAGKPLSRLDRTALTVAISTSAAGCAVSIVLSVLSLRYSGFLSRFGFAIFSPILKAQPAVVIALAILQLAFAAMLWLKKYAMPISRIVYAALALLFSFGVYHQFFG